MLAVDITYIGGDTMSYILPCEINNAIFTMENLGSLKNINDFEKLPRLRKVSKIKNIICSNEMH